MIIRLFIFITLLIISEPSENSTMSEYTNILTDNIGEDQEKLPEEEKPQIDELTQ